MWRFLTAINKNLVTAIPVMMILGFLFGLIFPSAFLKSFILPLTFMMVYPMMVTLKIKKVFEGGDVKAQLLTQLINFGIVPFVAFGLGIIFFKDNQYMALGLLLAGLVPTSGMTISWTGFAKGNVEAAVKMTVIGLTIGSIATPFYVKYLMGATIDVNILLVMKQIVVIVFVPMIAGFITQQGLVKKYGQKEFQQKIAPRFPGLSTIGVIGIVFVAIALKAKSIADAPELLLYIIIPLLLIYGFNFLLSTLIGKFFLPRDDAIALVYGSVMRNLSIALAIAINAFGPEGSSAALVVAIAYIIQVQSAAWYVKLTDTLFGKPVTETKEADIIVAEQSSDTEANDTITEILVPDIKKILYATDLSENARYAVKYACSIGDKYNSHVTILHIVPDVLDELSSGAGINLQKQVGDKKRSEFNEKGISTATEIIKKRISKLSERVMKEIPSCPVANGDIRVEVGDPVETITSIAKNDNYDLVVMGTHGHGIFEDFMVGSVAEGVIRQSSIPVLVVRLP